MLIKCKGGGLLSLAFLLLLTVQIVSAQSTPTRLTQSTGGDFFPTWNPANNQIAYVSPKGGVGSVFDLKVVDATGVGGEQAFATGPNTGFGISLSPSWIGSTGLLALQESVNGFEYMSFNTLAAPFNRLSLDGDDNAFTRLLSIPGGGGGGLIKISRNGAMALFRTSLSGGGGQTTIATAPVSSLIGQSSSGTGNIHVFLDSGADQLFNQGAALFPDGSKFILPVPFNLTSSSTHDLIVFTSDLSASPIAITAGSPLGASTIHPDVSPDGTKIVFSRSKAFPAESFDLYIANSDGSNVQQLTNTPFFAELYPSWSPDGTKIAYQGTHQQGRESTAPALNPGETFNSNIYVISAQISRVVGPGTTITSPPIVVVDAAKRSATFTFEIFTSATIKKQRSASLSLVEEANNRRKKKTKNYTSRYELELKNQNGDTRRKTSKKETLTVKNLPQGVYTARYRVQILGKKNGKQTVVGKSGFSPSAGFVIP